MKLVLYVFALILLLCGAVLAQEGAVPPISIGASLWHVDHHHIPTQNNGPTHAQREMNLNDKNYAREKRTNDMRGSAPDPSEMTMG